MGLRGLADFRKSLKFFLGMILYHLIIRADVTDDRVIGLGSNLFSPELALHPIFYAHSA